MIKIIGSDGSSSQTFTDNSGRYTFDNNIIINENISYDLTVSSEGYLSTNLSQSTIELRVCQFCSRHFTWRRHSRNHTSKN